ncbi:IS4 family transposase [Streptomyces sp. NBC_00063]|uniref:IS4 family transposase n=1 Tax=Streptomyces sp. NBC_00063 TaxID=2975638 RepID=UPI002250AB69|nr:IS4 family transposase [Streptomyces sp. NBC_00063]MCX5440964.1 IS4 family transposase [Streptomyces sp. NBC_00063]
MFAPGHLGELTRIVPFEMVDEVLAECGAIQQRLRKLPARVVVYLLLAAALFEECGYLAVWDRLTCALGSLPIPKVTGTALWNARARLGVRPVRSLFDMLRGPASAIRTAGARWAGLLVVAIDGTYLDVPDDPATRARLGKGSNQYATSGYPQICLVALVACGTRAVIDAVFGPRSRGETTHGKRLARSLRAGMVVLLDRGLSSNAFLETVADTGAAFLARLSAARKPPVLHRFDDGSFLSRIGQLEVRIIECEITIATTAGRHTGVYRLATTLLDHRRYPAFELVKLYHQRWEVESTYFAIKKSMLGRRVLRARTMAGIAQEVYALLTAYQLIRIAIADATDTVPGADPDRASFSIALQTARDQVIQAAGVIADTTIDLVGSIGRAVLNHLMPPRRLRVSPRAVKRPLSRYAYKSLRVDRRTYKATISIDILLTDPISP